MGGGESTFLVLVFVRFLGWQNETVGETAQVYECVIVKNTSDSVLELGSSYAESR